MSGAVSTSQVRAAHAHQESLTLAKTQVSFLGRRSGEPVVWKNRQSSIEAALACASSVCHSGSVCLPPTGPRPSLLPHPHLLLVQSH